VLTGRWIAVCLAASGVLFGGVRPVAADPPLDSVTTTTVTAVTTDAATTTDTTAATADAPGAPGASATWTTGDKEGLGTSTTVQSKVWYTLTGGTMSEVYYPSGDTPNVRQLQFAVTDGKSFTQLETDDTVARAVSLVGQLGVVSGTALDVVIARRLQDGDVDGDVRRALEAFPVPAIAHRVLTKYFREGGRAPGKPYVPVPKLSMSAGAAALELSVVANFAEVWLAKEGHDGVVGINFLEKVQMATPSAAYGAMLAGVDYVLMGAGIPAEIPQLLNKLAVHEPCSLDLHVDGATIEYTVGLDPEALTGGGLAPLRRPLFLAIVSAHVLAAYLAREDATRPDG